MRRFTTYLVVALGLMVALMAHSATASHPQTPLLYGCALKSNGLVRYVTSLNQCKPKQEIGFAIWPGPTHLCIKPDGSVRKVNSPAECGTGPPINRGTPLTVPSSTDAYFCAAASTGVLRYVTSPAQCTASETALVVANHAPTDIALSNSSVAENEPVGTTVGTLSATDPDPAATFTYSLVAGTGDTDNGSFTIAGTALKTNAVFDYETKSSYSIRVRVTDGYGGSREEQFTITVTDVVENAAPTDIQLSNSTVAENQPGGTNVGTLTTTDPDVGDAHTYSLVAGAGDDDNAKFQISGSTLQTAQPLDFEADSSLSVRIRTSDGGASYEEAFTITVTNANDPPSDIALSNSSVAENQPAGTNVGTLSATDQDAGATHTFSLVAGAGDDDNAKFQISGSTLQTAQSLDFEADNSLSVRVRADDGAGGTFEKSLTVTVTNVNEAPTDIALSNSSVAENEPVGTTVGTISATDPDSGDTHTFALVAGAGDADNASFQIDGSTLKTNAVFDFETKSSYSIRVRATDAGSLTFEEQLTITITNANEAPSDINLSNSSVAENQPAGTAVGTLSTVDDPGSTHTYTLVVGAGDTDNASFQIDGDVLESAAVFDFEVNSSYSIRVRTDDGGGGTFEKQFTITILNANDAPSDIALSNASVDENEAVGTAVGTLSATDQDVGDTHTFALVSGAGDTDNASFQIDGTTLETNAVFNFEVKNSYSIRIRVTDSGSATHEEQFTISINDVNDAPVAVADSFGNAVGNTLAVLGTSGSGPHIVLTGNVITNNDTDEDTTFPNTISAIAETVASTGGGSATIAADGSFTFLPGVGDKNQVDTFTYHITDGALQSAGTVSVTIANVLVWYVDDSAGAGDGRSNAPLNTLASLNGAGGAGDSDATGDVIFLYSGTYGGGLPLEASQKLTGEPHGLTVNPGSGNVTLVAAGGTNPTIGNSGGAGIGLANGVEVQRVNVNGTSGAGVTGSAVTNATIGGNTSIGGSTGNAFELSGAASGTIDVGSTISSSTARSVSVQNRSGGSVNLTGNVTDTGQGVFLNSNTGATVNLTGSLTISTGANAGFTATGGGTVNANTASNTIATTTGTALNVANTTIGASGLTFRSIAANGGVNGIVLNNTGATAGLTVTGNGGTCTFAVQGCTGGTIQNTTGDAISLTNTSSPSLSLMNIHDNDGNGVMASGVSALTLANSIFVANSDDVLTNNEANLRMFNMSGTSTITSSVFRDAVVSNVYWTPSAGTMTLNASGSTFGPNSVLTGNSGLLLDASGTANVTLGVTGGSFTGNRGDSLRPAFSGSASGNVTVSGGTQFTDSNSGVNFSVDSNADLTYNVSGSTFLRHNSHALQMIVNDTATAASLVLGTAANNVIGDTTADSGSRDANGISFDLEGAGAIRLAVTGNTIQHTDTQGIFIQTRRPISPAVAGPFVDLTLRDNSVASIDDNSAFPHLFQYGTQIESRNVSTMCLDIAGNSSTGIGGAQHFRVRQRDTSTFRLERLTGSGSDDTNVANVIAGQNDAGSTASVTHATTFTAVADGTCQNP